MKKITTCINLEIKLILQFFLGASAGTGVPRNTHKIGTQCGCEYGYKNYERFGSLVSMAVVVPQQWK